MCDSMEILENGLEWSGSEMCSVGGFGGVNSLIVANAHLVWSMDL